MHLSYIGETQTRDIEETAWQNTIKISTRRAGGISFSGITLIVPAAHKCAGELACQPCICYLLPLKGSLISNRLIGRFPYPTLICLRYIPLWLQYFCLP